MTAKRRKPTGPKPEILKVEGGWKDAVAHALGRGKPAKATPKAKKKRKLK